MEITLSLSQFLLFTRSMESTLKKRRRNKRQKSLYKNARRGGGGGSVHPDVSYPKQYRDPLLIERNAIIQEPQFNISLISLHSHCWPTNQNSFFSLPPSLSQEVHASTIKSTFPPRRNQLFLSIGCDVRTQRGNDGINHTNNRISVSQTVTSRSMYRICLKFFPLIEIHLAKISKESRRGAG